MQKITPFLWFDDQALAAVKFYTSIFKGSKILEIMRAPAGGPPRAGSILTVKFRLHGQEFVALNGGPAHRPNPAVSFVVNCQTQKEVDHYWKKLSAGGKEVCCGWLEDKYGFSWQIVPTVLLKLIGGRDRKKAGRVMKVMMGMIKLDIRRLQQAAANKSA